MKIVIKPKGTDQVTNQKYEYRAIPKIYEQ